MYDKIGYRIKIARREAKISQEKLAEMIGCSISFISRLENGKISTSLERLNEIAEVLNIGLENLLYDLFSDNNIYQDPLTSLIVYKIESSSDELKESVIEIIDILLKIQK